MDGQTLEPILFNDYDYEIFKVWGNPTPSRVQYLHEREHCTKAEVYAAAKDTSNPTFTRETLDSSYQLVDRVNAALEIGNIGERKKALWDLMLEAIQIFHNGPLDKYRTWYETWIGVLEDKEKAPSNNGI